MVTELIRNAVWQGMLDAERCVGYSGLLYGRYKKVHRLITLVVLSSALAGVGVLAAHLPVVIQHIASAVIGFLVVWDSIAGYARKSEVVGLVNSECAALVIEYQNLWLSLGHVDESADDAQAKRELARLSEKTSKAIDRLTLAGINENQKLNQRSTEDAYEDAYTVQAARYA